MTDDSEAIKGGPLATIAGRLTNVVMARAADAIGKVVGSYMPGVLARAQASKDDRDAKSTFRRGLVEAATRKAAENPDLVDRMLDRLVEEEFGKQERRETIAIRAIEYLGEESAEAPSEKPEPVTDDWLNLYNNFADKASSEALQDMWARVLSGEIRKPGSISLKTLQFVSVLDRETAEAASRLLPWLIGRDALFAGAAEAVSLADRMILRDAGLIGSLTHDLNHTAKMDVNGVWFGCFPNTAVVAHGIPGGEFTFSGISVSRTCKELSHVIPIEDAADAAAALVKYLKNQNSIKQLTVGPYRREGESVVQEHSTLTESWTRPEEVPPPSSP